MFSIEKAKELFRKKGLGIVNTRAKLNLEN